MGRAGNTVKEISIPEKISKIQDDIPKSLGILPDSQILRRPLFSKAMQNGSKQQSLIDRELTQAFLRISKRINSKNTEEHGSDEIDSLVICKEGRKFTEIYIDVSGEGKFSSNSGSANNFEPMKSASIDSVEYGSLKISFDDVSKLPVHACLSPKTVSDDVRKDQPILLFGSPKYFVPPKWFPRSSVLYNMHSKSNQICGEFLSFSPYLPSMHLEVGMLPKSCVTNQSHVAQFPIVELVSLSPILQSSSAINGVAQNCTLPTTIGRFSGKTSKTAIHEAFFAHFAQCGSQPEITKQQLTVEKSSAATPTYVNHVTM
ncbi:unnamed protein product [Gongylonema pulchrum]|uniref:Ovule protein n=1 Tax=Gongylonema pulchrum TaxID=637853 RepID=A0A183EHW0_9BILA|nr:unnamed protein product [Gongylonema pulchrum]